MTNERDRLLRTAIFDEIDAERRRHDKLWGQEFEDKHTPSDWLTFIMYPAAKAVAHTITTDEKSYRKGILKAAVMCVAALEAYDRAQGTVARHYE